MINGSYYKNALISGANNIIRQKDDINALNIFPVPDGDTGTNMSMTIKAAADALEELDSKSIAEIASSAASAMLKSARGNSGVILSQILRGISKGFEGLETADASQFAAALNEGSKSAYKAVMRPTEGTILSVIRATAEEVVNSEKDDISELLEEATKAAKIMLDKTPDLLPALKKAKVVDSGGMGLYIILGGMAQALSEGIEADISDVTISQGGPKSTSGANSTVEADIKFGYCTEFIIMGEAKKAKEFQDEIAPLGDSMIVVGYDDVIKVHIHTNDPGNVLSKAIKIGELSKIKIDNMREEHREILGIKAAEAKKEEESIKEEHKKYAFITVAMGNGITNIFKDLGVDYVIEGGQTMNPSTQDILDCIDKINADHIFVLPNNKNIIMASNQAAEISDKDVRVIPTTSIPQGITCITMFDAQGEVDENEEELKELISTVKTGSITYAVRDTEIDGMEIKEGNILGLIEGKIKEVGEDKFEVTNKVISDMVDENSELITIYYGADVIEEEVSNFISNLEEKYEDLDIQCYKGEQPLYYFLVSVE